MRKTIPALVRHTDPRSFMKGSMVTGATGAGGASGIGLGIGSGVGSGTGSGVSVVAGGSVSVCSDGSSAWTGPIRVTMTDKVQKDLIAHLNKERSEKLYNPLV
ncbi:MAG: hypothetical protein CAF41_013980 [Nitrospira sp. CG24A]|nr:MAG: hypothetical protein CAF41_013980 [Nitrospira sp. CG24A]